MGELHWVDGSFYEGHWKEGKANGKGRLVRENGEVYDGQWKDDYAEGQGRYSKWTLNLETQKLYSEVKYTGEWENNKKHGQGIEEKFDQNGKIIQTFEG